eukprot:gnl/TRDRNA2_/TRDRNA2_137885_c0_seq2.p1 gnl/TRDRNA2_/TRDRNA2_137885_c0~~gnl/TRDRNA2_/TRDRNA2_137885_c0_seq2.p1  ORF type:complete len:274 (+),score=43.45 gnl/TRDRNA2_/TRDRNA2_137885_c0_seq2:116-823(+)
MQDSESMLVDPLVAHSSGRALKTFFASRADLDGTALGKALTTPSLPRQMSVRAPTPDSRIAVPSLSARIAPVPPLEWQVKKFDDLNIHSLYDLLMLRSEVFVVEQNCVYLDLDGTYDKKALHLLGYHEGKIVAYARIFRPDDKYQNMSAMGRVVTASSVRGKGYGWKLMRRAVDYCVQAWPHVPVIISAQHYLLKFYGENGMGFNTRGDPYDEDGILHIDMVYDKHLSGTDIEAA